MKKARLVLLLLVSVSIISVVAIKADLARIFDTVDGLMGSVFFSDSVTAESLKETYNEAASETKKNKNNEKVRILVVPGHDIQFPGTQYKNLTELELTVGLGEKLSALLKKEDVFDVTLSQTAEDYNPELLSYFDKKRNAIVAFMAAQKELMERYVGTGEIERVVNVQHNAAPTEAAFRLYGMNRWANENEMDIVIHIHFNDYPGRTRTARGKYSGFAIYIPERQYSNAKGSNSVARSIHKRLATLYPESDLPKENTGLVEDQELIALGSNNTLDGASMLIEYGYIYEPTLSNPDTRNVVLEDLAFQTYLGITDFFGAGTNERYAYKTRLLPYGWHIDLEEDVEAKRDILSLQAVLTLEEVYPPPGKSKNDCGLTGFFGPCTKASIKLFQQKHGIAPAEGYVGEKTRSKLNALYAL